MVSDSGETRKVDKRTALALWDTSTLPGGLRKKRIDDAENAESEREGIMKFTFVTKKGNKVQVCLIDCGVNSEFEIYSIPRFLLFFS